MFATYYNFNPRSPHGERPCERRYPIDNNTFQPTLPARGATGEQYATTSYVDISTHAPRTGSDGGQRKSSFYCGFQPTLPARGATATVPEFDFAIAISTHAPRTGSDNFHRPHCGCERIISTHAPRTGSDLLLHTNRNPVYGISTHAPRTGSDKRCVFCVAGRGHFNPRSPHGERH